MSNHHYIHRVEHNQLGEFVGVEPVAQRKAVRMRMPLSTMMGTVEKVRRAPARTTIRHIPGEVGIWIVVAKAKVFSGR